jgi:lipoprotein-anchoring transpeptidase ErfK/SrfK
MARIAVALAVLALAGCGGSARPARPLADTGVRTDSGLSPAKAPATAGPARPRGRWPTARVRRRAVLRTTPGGRVAAHVGPRTEFGSPRVLGVLRRRGAWLRVLAPELPNGRSGWIPAAAVRLGATDRRITIDRSRRRLELRERGRLLLRFPVAVGRPSNPTPLGRFAVTDRLHTRRADSPYGCCAIALTGHQTRLPPGWPGGDRLAIHATPQAESIGQAASLGCLRAPTRGIRALIRRVPLGTPVRVVP